MSNPNPASKTQTFAIFCALKIDVRAVSLSYAQAHAILQCANGGADAKEAIHAEVSAMPGAIVKGQPSAKVASAKPSFRTLWESACEAGKRAAQACVPVPMVVREHANPLDDSSPVVRQYAPVMDGVCGFASVHFAGNTGFGKWAKKEGFASPAYRGGLSVWIGDYNQSLQKKEAHAYAVAAYLSENGVPAHGESRMD